MRKHNLFGTPQIRNIIVPAMPYMGGKRKLATKILNSIYDTVGDFNNLYDLFGGGAAMSVAGLLAGHCIVEINGGQFTNGRHTRGGKGYEGDLTKMNIASSYNVPYFQFTYEMLERKEYKIFL